MSEKPAIDLSVLPTFVVTWSMPIQAASASEACLEALATHRDPASLATIFVAEHNGIEVKVDCLGGVAVVIPDELPGSESSNVA